MCRDATSWEMTTHFGMHVCLLEKKNCYAALTAKTFANFAPFLDPKMGVEKWTQKWCQILATKMNQNSQQTNMHVKMHLWSFPSWLHL